MQLKVLKNLLATARRICGAESVWLRLVSELEHGEPVELHDGDNALEPYLTLSWDMAGRSGAGWQPIRLFGLDDALAGRVSDDGTLVLLRITVSDALLDAGPDFRPEGNRRATGSAVYGSLLLGCRFPAGAAAVAMFERHLLTADGAPPACDDWLAPLVSTAAQIAWELYQARLAQTDPVTHLPGPADFSAYLARAAEVKQRHAEALALLLVCPDDFALINREFGRERADEFLRATGIKVEATVRGEDKVFRYGGAALAVVARLPDGAAATTLAAKLHAALLELPLVGGQHRVSFSIGGAVWEAGADDGRGPRQICLCADQALNRARLLGGDQVVFFDGEFDLDDASNSNPLGSIFTADSVKDFRNGRILWNTISLIAAESVPSRLATAFINLLEENFTAAAALVEMADGELRALGSDEVADLGREQRLVVERAIKSGHSAWETGVSALGDEIERLAAPLVSRGITFGCLLLEGQVTLDASDQVFLKALADQVAGAIDRVRLAEKWAAQKESESERLREELRDLQRAVPRNNLIATSPAMRELLAHVQKIAPTDASILIMGESGTGKEVLARTVHELSNRHERALITVDCGAIAHSLIDSELFGRAKGAYTGAETQAEGRIAMADGGTLFLDEIGELPLDVQAKLLRFVQEKEVTPVGSTQHRIIDARIICATNRNLLQEVQRGRFREDLFYRLQVVQLSLPPLRERHEDIFALVNHFLNRFALQFGKPGLELSSGAWAKVEAHPWPGNVRELQNAVMRAVLTAESSTLEADDFQLGAELPAPGAGQGSAVTEQQVPAEPVAVPAPAPEAGPRPPSPPRPDAAARAHETANGRGVARDVWQDLRALLGEVVALALDEPRSPAPLGRWLVEDLVLSAAEICDGNTRRSGALLGMAETTFRRQLDKAKRELASVYASRSREWDRVTPVVHELVTRGGQADGTACPLVEACQKLLLEEIAARVGADVKRGAMLLDVSPPTYRRRLAANGGAA